MYLAYFIAIGTVFSLPVVYCFIRLLVKITSAQCKSPVCLVGKTAIVTGSYQGLGFETALQLASRGCRVILADKKDASESVAEIIKRTNNPNIIYKFIDMASFAAIRKFVKEIYESEERLDILINNAGNVNFGKKLSEDGLSLGMHTNVFGGFLLTYLLVDLLKKSAPSRIIFVSSMLAFFHKLNKDTICDPGTNSRVSRDVLLYCNSKMCNIITADGFAKTLKGTGVTCNSLHPGFINTKLFARMRISTIANWIRDQVLFLFSKTVGDGVQTNLHCALDDQLENITGEFFVECRPFWKPVLAKNEKFCEHFWDVCEKLVKIQPEEKL